MVSQIGHKVYYGINSQQSVSSRKWKSHTRLRVLSKFLADNGNGFRMSWKNLFTWVNVHIEMIKLINLLSIKYHSSFLQLYPLLSCSFALPSCEYIIYSIHIYAFLQFYCMQIFHSCLLVFICVHIEFD